ncbi:MAG: VTT domain-containing protein [Dermatophilaceae bacterium]
MLTGRLRAWTMVTGLTVALLVAFLVVEWARVPLLVDPRPWLQTVSVVAAILGVTLLVVDAFVPVPSSVVMVALGATFGLVGGIALSVVGSVGGFAVAYAVGRRSRGSVASAVRPDDVERGAGLVRRWGVLAIVASRPIPLVAETVAISAGAFGLRPTPALAAALVGAVGPAAVFSYAGWRGASTTDGTVIFAVVALASVIVWVLGRRLSSSADRPVEPHTQAGFGKRTSGP